MLPNIITGLIKHLTHEIECTTHVIGCWPGGRTNSSSQRKKSQRYKHVLFSKYVYAGSKSTILPYLYRWGFLFCYFGVSNSWKWWNSGGFVWPGMTDDSAVKIGHCPPLSFIMSVGQVWWREPGSWERRSFIQNEGLHRVEILLFRQQHTGAPAQKNFGLRTTPAGYGYSHVHLGTVEGNNTLRLTKNKPHSLWKHLLDSQYKEKAREGVHVTFGVALWKNVSARETYCHTSTEQATRSCYHKLLIFE